MNVTIRRIEPTTTEPETWLGSPALEPANVWEEDIEHADYQSRPLARRGRRLWLGIAAMALVAGVGFAGRLTPDGRQTVPGSALAAASDAAPVANLTFTVTSPEADATVKGATVEVAGVANEPVPAIHLGVVVGGAVIGWTTVRVDRPGPWSASIPVFAPPVAVEAQLLASSIAPGTLSPRTALQMQAMATIRRSFSLRSGGPVGLWPTTLDGSGATTIVSVGGCAPVGIGRVGIRLTGHDGGQLAATDAAITLDDARPGAIGGYSLGLGSFTARLTVPGPIREGPVRVAVDWRDAIGGEWGTSVLTIIPATRDSRGLR